MIDFHVTFEKAEEMREFMRNVTPVSIYDDVAELQESVTELREAILEVATSILDIEQNVLPDKCATLNDVDLNTQIGKIIIGYGNGCLNKPTGSNGFLINLPHNSAPDKFGKQIWITRPSNNVFLRNLENGVFGEWVSIRFDTGWYTLSLTSGVNPQNESQYPCRYRKVNDRVYVDGCVKGLSAAGQIVATLPEGYRPSKSYYYQTPTNGGKTDTFRVHTDGRIEWMATTGTFADTNYHFIKTEFFVD